ncbi:class I SAM-dependent methyltransferase [Murinocardiopsis flavida]|uniref:class I SAM-dependent methyltransferase n=1 Tax=Murinocardiopsis flavida TaxID=645275 RepID=UPI001FE54414|nr:class I SAM-dependent methyltransferase [Murinocardiopsis flavida]
MHDTASYWDRYAQGMKEQTPQEAVKNAFGWCQYPGHGPGDELLGDPMSTLELGFGHGNAVAALAAKGIDATGIDVSPAQYEQALARWGHLTGAHFAQTDAADYLASAERQWEAVYSIWGALWFTDPDILLPLIRNRLRQLGEVGDYGHASHFNNAPQSTRSLTPSPAHAGVNPI